MNDDNQIPSHPMKGRNTSFSGKDKAKRLAPLNILKKDDENINAQIIKTKDGFVVENETILSQKGINLKSRPGTQTDPSSMPAPDQTIFANESDHNMSVESFHASNLSIDQSGNMSVLQEESVKKDFSKMSISGESSANMSNTIQKTTYSQDKEGFMIPAKKNVPRPMNTNPRAPVINRKYIHNAGIGIENPTNVDSTTNWEGQDQVGNNVGNNAGYVEEKKEEDDKNEIKLEDLKYVGELGSGSQGHVRKMVHKPTGALIALKIIDLHTDDNFLKALKTELNTLQECNSEYIVKCYGAFLNGGNISIALEFMDKGSLADLLKKVGTISETILGMITYQVLKGLEYLHKNMKVIHRDIKPSNLLINSDGQIKIADFGVSGKIDFTLQYKSTWVGTLPYMSPERCRGDKYNFDTDLWSLGLTILECALGRYPYSDLSGDQSKMTFFDLVDILSTKPPPKLPEGYSPAIQDFVAICLRKEPGTRASASELLKHDFVKRFALVKRNTFKGWLETI